jgi:hypothetical protein
MLTLAPTVQWRRCCFAVAEGIEAEVVLRVRSGAGRLDCLRSNPVSRGASASVHMGSHVRREWLAGPDLARRLQRDLQRLRRGANTTGPCVRSTQSQCTRRCLLHGSQPRNPRGCLLNREVLVGVTHPCTDHETDGRKVEDEGGAQCKDLDELSGVAGGAEVRMTAATPASSRRKVLASASQAAPVPLLPRGGRLRSWQGGFRGPTILAAPLRQHGRSCSPAMEDVLGEDGLVHSFSDIYSLLGLLGLISS